MFAESSLAISKLLGLTPLFISDRVMFEQKPQTKLSFFRISIVSRLYEPSAVLAATTGPASQRGHLKSKPYLPRKNDAQGQSQ